MSPISVKHAAITTLILAYKSINGERIDSASLSIKSVYFNSDLLYDSNGFRMLF